MKGSVASMERPVIAAVHREIGRRVDMRRTVVAVDAIHAALVGLVDLRLRRADCLSPRIRSRRPVESSMRTQGMTCRCSSVAK